MSSSTTAPPAGARSHSRSDPDLLTVQEAAALLRTTPRWVKRAYLDGRLAHVKVGAHVRIPRKDLGRFVARNTHRAR